MAIAVASISVSVYKYVIHRIAISYAAWHVISVQIREKHHRLLCRSTLYLYLYCIYIVLLYFRSTYTNNICIRFTILFHLKTMTATTFDTFHICECLLGSSPSFVHNMTAPNFKSSIQPENCCTHPSCLHATFIKKMVILMIPQTNYLGQNYLISALKLF